MRESTTAEATSSESAALELYAYTSTYAGAPEDVADVLAHITRVAAKNNARVGITGVLLHDRGRFVQVIEGSPEALDTLIAALARDPRHDDLCVLLRTPIVERTFQNWHMVACDVGTADPVAASTLSDMTHAYLGNFRAVATEYFACVARVVRAAGGGVTNVAGAR